MKRFITYAVTGLLLASCGTDNKEETTEKKKKEQPKIDADIVMGGTFKMPIEDPATTLNPKFILDLNSAQIAGQIYDGLLKYDAKTTQLSPDLASSWNVSEDLTTYKFVLRKDVVFHPHQGNDERLMTHEDVIASFKYYVKDEGSEKPSVAYESVFKYIKGAAEYRKGGSEEIEGISFSGDTLTIQLVEPSSTFVHKMANIYTSILPKEIASSSFETVGTGPFKLVENSDKIVALAKHEKYFLKDEKGNAMPYLDSVHFIVMPSKHMQLQSFEEGSVHIIEGLPLNKVNNIMDEKKEALTSIPPEYELINEPELSTQYYSLNCAHPVLSKKKVRQAISYAIDRNRIVQRVLNNQAYDAGNYGITPPLNIFKGYGFKDIKTASYTHDPEKAKQLLAEAGHPNGEGIPTLKLEFNKGTVHSLVASDVATQLLNKLNINIEIEGVPFKQKLEDASYGKSDIFRGAWAADFPSPETFLMLAYGKNVPADANGYSYPNSSRYKNPAFDALMDKAAVTKNLEERYKLYTEAEKILMEDSPYIILWYEEKMKMIYSKVRNYYNNPLSYLDLTPVYLKEWTGQEYKDFHGID